MKHGKFAKMLAISAATFACTTVHAAFCDADLDSDGTVGAADLALLLGAWGPNPGDPADLDSSGGVDAADLALLLGNWNKNCGETPTITDLAGRSLFLYPFFEYTLAVDEGEDLQVAIDPGRFPDIVGQTCDIYVVAAKTAAQWGTDSSLTDVTGGAQTESFVAGTIQDNTFTISGGDSLSGDAGTDVGVGYDVVCDCDQDGQLGAADYIDGLDLTEGTSGEEAGLYIVHDLVDGGPLGVTQTGSYSVGTVFGIVPTRVMETTFYPSGIASMGELPVIVVSHGNGHQFVWYDHIGNHMASYGYVVMSHQNNTGPGIETASSTTLGHTDAFLDQQDTISGGVLDGHLDNTRITWIGHSRGGEGVVRAYDRIDDGTWVPTNYTQDGLTVVNSICPTDFLGVSSSNPHEGNYHLFYTGADADVSGSPSGGGSKPFAIYERGNGQKGVTYLHGAGHGDFHDGGSPGSVATGPDLIGRPATHTVLLSYFLAVTKYYNEDCIPCRDFLTRMYDEFHAPGIPSNVEVAIEYRDALSVGNDVIDDYETQTSTGTSSSGGSVTFNVSNVVEDRMQDTDGSFVFSAGVPMNGMTRAKNTSETHRAVVFDYQSPTFYEYEVVGGLQDFSDDEYLSFRACQGTRHPRTDSLDASLSFGVTLRDGSGTESTIYFRSFGTITRTYERGGSGTGFGWANEYNTVRLRLTDFLNNGSGIDLTDIEAVRFELGSSPGSSEGRIGIDDVHLTKE